MSKKLDVTGQRFGRWTALDCDEEMSKEKSHTYWNYICDCGTKKTLRRTMVSMGKSVSCGCYAREMQSKLHSKPPGVAAFNSFLNTYIQSSRERDIEFKLTKSEFREVTSQSCYYCGKEPREYKTIRHKTYALVNGIDRVDSSTGYQLDNIVPCCKMCNYMKNVHSKEEFLEHIERIYKHGQLRKDS